MTGVQHRIAKKSGNQYGSITVEDFTGEISVLFMGKAYQEFSAQLQADTIGVIRGRVSQRDDGVSLHAYSFTKLELSVSDDTGPVTLAIPENRATEVVLADLVDVFRRHPGDSEVRLRLLGGAGVRVFSVPHQVAPSADFYGEVKSLLGPNALL